MNTLVVADEAAKKVAAQRKIRDEVDVVAGELEQEELLELLSDDTTLFIEIVIDIFYFLIQIF